jgi:hypothetical protein
VDEYQPTVIAVVSSGKLKVVGVVSVKGGKTYVQGGMHAIVAEVAGSLQMIGSIVT